MSDRKDDLNPASDLAPFADAMQRLAPQPSQLSRDALLFAAGRAAARSKVPAWAWPSATGLFAATSFILAAFMLSPAVPAQTQVRYELVYVPVETQSAKPSVPIEAKDLAPNPRQKAAPSPSDSNDIAKALKTRRDVLRWGVEMLPESKGGGSGKSPDVVAAELRHWLNLPPGTFAVPPHLQPKKNEENDE